MMDELGFEREMHSFIALNEQLNSNKELRIEPRKPHPSTRKSGKRRGTLLEPPLSRRRKQDDQLVLGKLERLGSDNLFDILTRLDVHSLHSCLGVNKALVTLITSPSFRRSWRGKNAVLAGSRTCHWRLLSTEGDSTSFRPLNNPRCPGEVVASAGGLLCINMHPSNESLELVVGNPLTHEWVALPVPEGKFDTMMYGLGLTVRTVTSNLSLGMEVFNGGHFKVAAHERCQWMHRVSVYDSCSDSWGVTELHYPSYSDSKWSSYDLTADRWRVSVIGGLGRNVIETGEEWFLGDVHRVSHPVDQGFCVWEYKSTTYFASPWVGTIGRSISGYGVWKLEVESGELVLVSARRFETLAPHVPLALVRNDDRFSIFTSCNALDNLVCFMGESLAHPPVPVIMFNIDRDSWSIVEDPIPPEIPISRASGDYIKACDHTSVALPYAPSLLAPAVNRAPPPKSSIYGKSVCRKQQEDRDSRSFRHTRPHRRHQRRHESSYDRHHSSHRHNRARETKHQHHSHHSSHRHNRARESDHEHHSHHSSHKHNRARESKHQHREHQNLDNNSGCTEEDHRNSERCMRHHKSSSAAARGPA